MSSEEQGSSEQQGSNEQQRLPYIKLAPDGIGAMQELEHYLNALSGLEKTLLEMVRLRVSQLNGCHFCIGQHRQELGKTHAPETLIDAIPHWRESDSFTQRQRAGLLWAEAVTNIQSGHASDADYAVMQQHFSEKEIVDLTLAISSINAWNRLGIAFRARWDAGKAGSKKAERRPENDEEQASSNEEEAS